MERSLHLSLPWPRTRCWHPLSAHPWGHSHRILGTRWKGGHLNIGERPLRTKQTSIIEGIIQNPMPFHSPLDTYPRAKNRIGRYCELPCTSSIFLACCLSQSAPSFTILPLYHTKSRKYPPSWNRFPHETQHGKLDREVRPVLNLDHPLDQPWLES